MDSFHRRCSHHVPMHLRPRAPPLCVFFDYSLINNEGQVEIINAATLLFARKPVFRRIRGALCIAIACPVQGIHGWLACLQHLRRVPPRVATISAKLMKFVIIEVVIAPSDPPRLP